MKGQTMKQINEPTLIGAAMELLKFLDLADARVANFRGCVFGEGEQGGVEPNPTTLDGMLRLASTKAACLCGSLATINTRFGCTPEVPTSEPAHAPDPILAA